MTQHTLSTASVGGSTAGTAPAPIVVKHSLRPPDGTTKYVDQLVGGAPAQVTTRYFSWRSAIFEQYDVFHVHWPELLIRGRSRWQRWIKRRALDVLLVRLRLQRIPLVWTAHNLAPHEAGPASERRSLARMTRAVDLIIKLNPTTPLPSDTDAVTILHGHYVDRFAAYPVPPVVPGRMLYFGIIRPYKGVSRLMEAFARAESAEFSLHIVGDPHPGQAEIVSEYVAQDTRTAATLRFVDDRELVDEVGNAELVVLPYREQMQNSGAVLVALSLSRPVLVPESASNRALSDEVGPGWVIQYPGELSARILTEAIDGIRRAPPAESPRLAGRDWAEVGLRHYTAYRSVLQRVRGSG